MANGSSAFAAALAATPTTRNTAVNYHDYNLVRQLRRDVVTMLGNEASAAYHDLGPCNRDGYVFIPEESRVRFGLASGVGTVDITAKIQQVIYAAAPVAVTWTRSTTTATVTTPTKHNYVTGQILSCTLSSDVTAITGTAAAPVNKTITVTGDFTYTFTCLNAGAASGTATIGSAAGSVRDLTAALTINAATSVLAFVAANALVLPVMAALDRLRMEFTTVITTTAGRTFLLEMAVDAPRS